jgi:hypothetical protein
MTLKCFIILRGTLKFVFFFDKTGAEQPKIDGQKEITKYGGQEA